MPLNPLTGEMSLSQWHQSMLDRSSARDLDPLELSESQRKIASENPGTVFRSDGREVAPEYLSSDVMGITADEMPKASKGPDGKWRLANAPDADPEFLTPEQMMANNPHWPQPDPDVPVSEAFLKRFAAGRALDRILSRTVAGAERGFGQGGFGFQPGSEASKFMERHGIFTDYSQGNVTPLRLTNEAVLRPAAAGLDAFARALGAMTHGAAGLIGGIAEELGENQGMSARLERDTASLLEITGLLAGTWSGSFSRLKRMPDGTIAEEQIAAGIPRMSDFSNATKAITEGTDHPIVMEKLLHLYRVKGLHPAEVAVDVEMSPLVRQSMLSRGDDLPEPYGGGRMSDPPQTLEGPGGGKPPVDPPSDVPPSGADGGGYPPQNNLVPAPGGGDVGPPGGGGRPPGPPKGPDDVGPVDPPGGPPAPIPPTDRTGWDYVRSKLSIGESDPERRWTFSRFYTATVDRFFPVQEAVRASGLKLDVTDDPYKLARLYRGWSGKAQTFLRGEGPFNFHTLDNIGPSLESILKPISTMKDFDDFRTYVAAVRASELEVKRGIKAFDDFDANVDKVKAVVREGQDRGFPKVLQQLVGFQNSVAKYLRDSGVISKAGYDAMVQQNKYYVPFNRVMDPDSIDIETLGGASLRPKNPVHAIEGSARQIKDPLENIIRNTLAMVSAAEKNVVASKVAEMFALSKPTGHLKKQSRELEPITRETRVALDDFFLRNGFDIGPDNKPTNANVLRESFEDLLRPVPAGHIRVFKDGRASDIEVGEDLANAINGLDVATVSTLEKVLGKPANLLRWGALNNPDFWARHVIRESMVMGPTFLKAGGKGAVGPVTLARGLVGGIMGRLGKDKDFDTWLKAGGGSATMASLGRRYLQDNLEALTRQTGLMTRVQNIVADPNTSWLQKGGNLLGTPFKAAAPYTVHPLQMVTEIVMEASKLGAFKKALHKGTKTPAAERVPLGGIDDGFEHQLTFDNRLPEIMRGERYVKEGTTVADALKAAEDLKGATLGEFVDIATGDTSAKVKAFEAAWISRETGIDDARIGAKMRGANMMIAFANARIQDFDVLARLAKTHPVQTAGILGTAITVPSVLLWLSNHDDPRYQALPQWQKDLFWIVPTDNWEPATMQPGEGEIDGRRFMMVNGTLLQNNGTIFRIPKPFLPGLIFGTVPERLLEDYVADNPKAYRDLLGAFSGMIVGDVTPVALVPVIEQMRNRTVFTGQNLIPGPLEGQLPEYQFTNYTTETAKAIGSALSSLPWLRNAAISPKDLGAHTVAHAVTSPIVIENYIRGWSGTTGLYLLQAVDAGLRAAGVLPDKDGPLKTLADIPVVRAFTVRYPSASVQAVQDFYDMAERDAAYYKTFQARAKEGDMSGMARTLEQGGTHVLARMDGIKRVLSQHNSAIRGIWKNPQMSPAEKRQMIDQLYHNMIAVAKTGVQSMEQSRKEFETLKLEVD